VTSVATICLARRFRRGSRRSSQSTSRISLLASRVVPSYVPSYKNHSQEWEDGYEEEQGEGFDPEEFIFGDRRPFEEVGLTHPLLLQVLPTLGYMGTTKVQATTIPLVLSDDRRAVVVNAETGSGKTLSYVLPALEIVLREGPRPTDAPYPLVLILVPSKELAFQVNTVVTQLTAALRKAGLDRPLTVESTTTMWPVKGAPDVLIATPRAAAHGLKACAAEDEISRRAALRRLWDVQLVVFDEADLLLGGGARTEDVHSVMVALAASFPNRPREVSPEAQRFYQGGVPVEVLQEGDLQWRSGRAKFQRDGSYNIKYDDTGEWENYVKRARIRGPGIGLHVEYGPRILLSCATLPSYKHGRVMTKRDHVTMEQKQVEEVIDNKLYNSGIGSPDWLMKRWFPAAIRIESEWIHRRHPCIVKADWIFIDGENQAGNLTNMAGRIETMVKILKEEEEGVQTMIFANSPDACIAAELALKGEGIKSAPFHSAVPYRERMNSLKDFATGEVSIMIATDLAARGLDLPVCRHVLQLEFAQNVVDYVHRVGRAARAGRASKITNLWSEKNRAVRESIMKAPQMGLDGAIYRRKGNRGRLRRIRRRQKVAEFAYDDLRRAGRLARERTRKPMPSRSS